MRKVLATGIEAGKRLSGCNRSIRRLRLQQIQAPRQVLFNSLSFDQEIRKVTARQRMTGFGCASEPQSRLGVIMQFAVSSGIEQPKVKCRLRVALFRGHPVTLDRFGIVSRDTQRKSVD